MSKELIRQKIDEIDLEILKLLNKRGEFALEIWQFKKRENLPYYDPVREQKILESLQKRNKGPLPGESIAAIFREVLSGCRNLQKPVSLSFLGPKATFSHFASIKLFGSSIIEKPCKDIGEVFENVEKKISDFGIVPIENSTEGIISYTLDCLVDSSVKICGEVYLNISFYILSTSSSYKTVKKIYSHSKPLEQCSEWLKQNLGDREIVQVSSTAEAAQNAKLHKASAAIAGLLAAELYELKILVEKIENLTDNKTRFLLIGNSYLPKSLKNKTSIIFSVKHKAGSLYRALKAFDKHKVNMTMIQSRPSKKVQWEYVFFVEMQGHIDDENIKLAVNDMKKETTFFKVLGSYSVPDYSPCS